jgi:gas vesicle protein
MKFLSGFMMGAVMGVGVALLFAPSSGDELRANIAKEVDSQYVRVQKEIKKGLDDLQAQIDEVAKKLEA